MNVLLALLLTAAPVGLDGTWAPKDGKGDVLVIDAGTWKWGSASGRVMTQGNEAWLLDETPKPNDAGVPQRTGVKWTFKVTKKELRFEKPEDFLYEGGGRYLYLQFTDPKTVHTFTRSK
jgi:hypothetical protein